MKQKRLVTILILAMILLTIGCVDYKAYDVPKVETPSNTDLQPQTGAATTPPQEEPKNQTTTKVETVELPDPKTKNTTNPELQVIRVKESDVIKLKASIKDPDQDPINYSFSKPLNSKGEWKTNYGDAGEYLVTLSASDGKLTSTKDLKLIVQRVNVPPIIEDIKDMRISEGELVNYVPKVKDPNSDPVTVTVSEPLKNGVFRTDHSSSGDYTIKVTASDGELKTERNFLLKVLNVNVKPQITNVRNISVKEGELVRVKPIILDLDEDPIKTTISDPVGDDGSWQTKFTDHGEYIVTVTASDGIERVTKQVRVEIIDVNMAPEIISVELQK